MQNIEQFIEWLNLNYDSEGTKTIYLKNMKCYFKHKDNFDQESINSYLLNKNVKNNSFNQIIISFRIYQKFLQKYLKKEIDIDFPKTRRSNSRTIKFITEKELDDILSKLTIVFQDYDKAKAILSLLFYTGMRPLEVVRLNRSDIDFDNNIIELKNTKTKRDRIVPFPNKIKKYIESYFGRYDEIDNAFNIKPNYIIYICTMIKKYFGIKHQFSPYVLRHSFAKWFLKKTHNDYNSLKQLMGHSSLMTTMIYANKNNDEAIETYKKLFKSEK